MTEETIERFRGDPALSWEIVNALRGARTLTEAIDALYLDRLIEGEDLIELDHVIDEDGVVVHENERKPCPAFWFHSCCFLPS